MPDQQQEQKPTWLQEKYTYTRPRRGQIREATIIDIGENDMLVDLGVKRDGVVLPRDLDLLDDAYRTGLHVGDRVPVVILQPQGNQGEIIVSISKGRQREDWLRAEQLMESQECFEAEVIDFNRGGLLVQFGRLRGFVPTSHVRSLPRGLKGEALQKAKSRLLGQSLWLVVIEVRQRKRRLVLSERKANRRRQEALLNALTEGEVHTGTVRSIVRYGAFVDLGGMDGLLHISELDWKHVRHPQQVLNVGDQVQVYILRVDRERGRISLSRKRLLPDPWSTVTEDLPQGAVIQGTVTNVVDFGAFVDVGKGIEGLVHVSEMPDGDMTRDMLRPQDVIWVQVLNVDVERHRISLRMRTDLQDETSKPKEKSEHIWM